MICLFITVAYRISVIFRSEGLDALLTFWVVWAIVSSMERDINPPSAIPPKAVFFRKLRRFSMISEIMIYHPFRELE